MHLVSLYQWITSNITGCEVAPALCYTVNGDWLCQWERAIFDSQGIHTPWPNTKKLLLVIMSATPTVVPNLVQICPRGGLLGEWVKYDEFLFIYLFIPFFRQLTYRSDPSTDFHAWWLKRHGLAFREFRWYCSRLWIWNTPKTQIWGVNRCF